MTGKTDIERFAYVCLLVSAFGTGFSILVGRVFMALAVVFLIVNLARERKRPIVTATGWLALLFFLIAVVATAQGVDPAAGFAKIDRLLWFAGIPVTAMLVTSWQRLASVLKAYAFGTGVKALLTIAWNPVMAMQDISVGKQFNFMASLIDKGSMTYAQALVLGMVISLAFLFICRLEQKRSVYWWMLFAVQTVAFIMMFKRGSWICGFGVLALFVASKTNWKYLLILVVAVMSTFVLPPVRARMEGLKQEFQSGSGRMMMWSEITPVLVREHPWLGIGYRVLTPDMMAKINRHVERNRNHLHSNIAQVVVETGFIGLFVYLLWMGSALFEGIRLVFSPKIAPAAGILSMALLLMLVFLLANGLVEYNFGDGELILAYGIVMGCISSARRLLPESV